VSLVIKVALAGTNARPTALTLIAGARFGKSKLNRNPRGAFGHGRRFVAAGIFACRIRRHLAACH